MQHTFLYINFLCRCFARLKRETSRNFLVTHFMEEVSYVLSFTFFHCHSFSPCIIGGRYHFSFCQCRYKKFFKSPSPFFSLSFAGPPPTFSFSLSFSCSIFQICGHDNLSKLNTIDKTDTEKISAFRFRLY